ncbi:lysophospholipid acyltransferase family protein [Mesonia sp. K7]|uniref:lysophospholipid acyltransferase family protein n=1 Tax=Mesonia sp. K7 TaxID=2218606 RepID=UPI000DAAB447|nr:lysophospholipid acyltransferase family protein [Mesonia sp. K7]PZD79256.1 lipid A biosynthesis acyltransferase [Mesonia sp. K7]
MQKLIFYLAYPFLWIISKLPFSILYLISDVVYFLVYHIVRYRREVVRNNLKLAFPEKSEKEIKRIEKKSYQHFCDMFLEMIKPMSISDTEFKKRFYFKNPEEARRLENLDRNYIALFAHYATYEWTNAMNFYDLSYRSYAVYKPISNPYFDKMIRDIRSKNNSEMIPMKEVAKTLLLHKRNNIKATYAFIADQSPRLKDSKHTYPFFGYEVPVFVGPEFLAKKFDLPVTYLKINKIKRGYYEAEMITLTEHPKEVEDFKITDKYYELLEAQIRANPEYYLWTHKRWKHKRI